ncbi:hypothetical protein F5146DRAFT_1047143 [Armillaria mellea]|nr:hypothetical protein F5146DRAFT_1047143 [Armillaria mellea]
MYSYNNPSASWQHPSSEPPNHDARDPRRHRAATAPAYNPYVQPPPPHPTSHPRVLTPGHIPPTIHNPSLYFGNRPIMTTPGPYPPGRPPFPHPATISYQRPQQWPYDANDSYFPPSKPPVPPPPLPPAPEPIPRLPSPARPRDVLPIPEEQTQISPSPSSAKELAAALQISQSESMKQAQFLEKLSNQEEEDLARALEESLQSVSLNSYTSGSPHFYNSEAGPSTDTGRWTCISTGLSASPRLASDIDDDEAYARRLAAEDEAGPSESCMADDEALARRLAAEEEEEQRYRQQELEQSSQSDGNRPDTGGHTEQSNGIARMPDEGLARRLAAEEEIEKSRAMDAGPVSAPPPAYDALPSPTSLNLTDKGSDAGLKVDPQLYRSNSSGSAASYTSSESQSNPPTQGSRRSSGEISSYSDVKPVSPRLSAASSVSLPTLPEASENAQGVVNGNQFVDAGLLHGVSIGFTPPVITSIMHQMSTPMPNIVSLPYGRCPPLHFQAPNWRHLLKLMARLSGTRIEPTPEAIAVVKTDLFLRTVIQFIRPHPASQDWRSIIWFSIDHPVPASLPGARKYTNGDVDVLPWSYTLSAMPALLRDNADSQISQTYTIPSTEARPLDESRRYSNDGSSGMRKLSRMMDRCYPTLESMDLAESSERSGMGRVFRKVMGRGNKNNKQGRGGNMDTYELVTPFVSEEWG